jgi:hypothetical protein
MREIAVTLFEKYKFDYCLFGRDSTEIVLIYKPKMYEDIQIDIRVEGSEIVRKPPPDEECTVTLLASKASAMAMYLLYMNKKELSREDVSYYYDCEMKEINFDGLRLFLEEREYGGVDSVVFRQRSTVQKRTLHENVVFKRESTFIIECKNIYSLFRL